MINNPDDLVNRAQRFALAIPMRYRGNKVEVWQEATTVNVSTSGILFRPAQPFLPPRVLHIALALPALISGKSGAEIRCRGTFVRQVSGASQEEAPMFAVTIGRCRIVRKRGRSGEVSSLGPAASVTVTWKN